MGYEEVNASKQGVLQVLNRLTYISTFHILEGFKLQQIIQVNLFLQKICPHGTSWGYICPTEIPEGQAVGVVKNLAMSCEVSISETSRPVRYYIEDFMVNFNEIDIYKYNKLSSVKVFHQRGLDEIYKTNLKILFNL